MEQKLAFAATLSSLTALYGVILSRAAGGVLDATRQRRLGHRTVAIGSLIV